MAQLGCISNAELAQKIVKGMDEATPEQLTLLDEVLADLQALVATRFIAALDRDKQGEQQHWLGMKHSATPIPVSRRRLAEVRRFLNEQ